MRDEISSLFGVGFGTKETNFEGVGADGAKISVESVDDVFVEVLTEIGAPQLPIKYLHGISTLAAKLRRVVLKNDPLGDSKREIFSAIVASCASYGLICFQIPDMVLNNDLNKSVQLFIDNQTTHAFLGDIVERAAELEFLVDLLGMILPATSARLDGLHMLRPEWSNHVALWEFMVSIKPVCAVLSEVAGFWPPEKALGLDFEHKTLLGPLLRLSPLDAAVAGSTFGSGATNTSFLTLLDSALRPLAGTTQSDLKIVFDRLWYIIDKLVRGLAPTRNSLLRWFGDLVNVSHLRTGSHLDALKLASDGFMVNILLLLVRLSLPFLDFPGYTKLDKIDRNYFGQNNPLVDVSEEPRMYLSPTEAAEFYAEFMSDEPHFITQCFYLTSAYLQYGIGGMITNHEKMSRDLKNRRRRIEEVGLRAPPRVLEQFYAQANQSRCLLYAIEAVGWLQTINSEIFEFVAGASQFLLRTIDPQHKHPQQRISIPLYDVKSVSELGDYELLKTKAPVPWKYLPEFIIEGMINYCKFISGFIPNPLIENDNLTMIFAEFATVLLRCPELLGNPHMKGNVVEIFFRGVSPFPGGRPGFLSKALESNSFLKEHILYSLLDVYVSIEKTGASSQFYDKFNSRFAISSIIERLWENDFYKRQLTGFSQNNVEFFVRFVARMLNDTTYLFDEAFDKLNAIHNKQVELAKREAGEEGNTEEHGTTEELTRNLQSDESMALSYMGLANQTMVLFKLFTAQVPEGFVIHELVDRLAGMLDYNLSLMVGPKCLNLKVKEPEKYKFEPRKILGDICQVYVNLSGQKAFVLAVARDGRSFDLKWFEKAGSILMKRTSVQNDVISRFLEFGRSADQERISVEQEELEMGEIPDEFLDPLMYTLMEDPVVLPGSKITIDRSTIKAHLLSDPTDPFNRMPLKLEEVVDDVEMREKIAQWRGSRK